MELHEWRRTYLRGALEVTDVDPDPIAQVRTWFHDAVAAGIAEPNAMILATATPDGFPSARTVLLKGMDERGFVLYTHLTSRKGRELAANPRAALVLPWHEIDRQVRIEGDVEVVDRDEVERYFASRPHGSRVGAWASDQSEVIADRSVLEDRAAAMAERWPEGSEVPVPEGWGGFRVVPRTVELWQGRDSRLHDRLRYTRAGDAWTLERLAP